MRAVGIAATMSSLLGCVAAGPKDECKPINDRCDGDVIQTCQLDIELLQRGRHVYVWTDVLVCEDDEVLGPYTCVETALDRRVEASCELESQMQAPQREGGQ